MTHLGDLLSAYLDGEVTARESAAVRDHLAACERCRGDVADIVLARRALRALPVLELPSGLLAEAGLAAPVIPWRRRPRVWAAAAAAGVALFIGATAVSAPDSVGIPLTDVSQQYERQVQLDPGVTPKVLPVADLVGEAE